MKHFAKLFALSLCTVAMALLWWIIKDSQHEAGSALGYIASIPSASADTYDPNVGGSCVPPSSGCM